MTPRRGLRELVARCAHLGFADDPFSRGEHASDEHRCYAHMGRDRIDLAHQKRFCLTSAHTTCPFLLVNAQEQKRDLIAEARDWWRNVSPADRSLTASQLGRWVELGAAGAVLAFRLAIAGLQWLYQFAIRMLERWRTPKLHPAVEVEVESPVILQQSVPEEIVAEPAPVEIAAEPAPVEIAAELAPVEIAAEPVAAAIVVEEMTTEPRVVESAPHQSEAREWFWRAKNAETLDELVQCLERAYKLDPTNEMISTNLLWAIERLEVQREAKKSKPPRQKEGPVQQPSYSAPRTPVIVRLGSALLSIVRTVAAVAAFGVAVVLFVSGLPIQMRESVLTANGLPTAWVPDASGLVHVPLSGGYDLGMALPYALGFIALFVAMGLMQRGPSLAGRR